MHPIPNVTDLSIEDAVSLLLPHAPCPREEQIAIECAAGRVLAQDILAQEMMPPFARSPYDGYAFRAADTQTATKKQPAVLRIVEEIRAGCAPPRALKPGEAAKILTGGPVPEGADVTIKYEDTLFDENNVSIFKAFRPNTDIVPAGEDVALGDVIGKRGTTLTPAHIGLLAGLGVAKVPVFCAPVVAIISTGDELVSASELLTPAKIRNTSYYVLRSILEQNGIRVLPYRQAQDTVEAVKQAIVEAHASADVVLTTGGVSVGDYDVVRAAAEAASAETLFWKVKMKPGSALLAATLKGKMILGLSGNPAAAVIGLLMIALPYLRKCAGRELVLPERIQVSLSDSFQKASPQRRLIPGRLVIDGGKAYFTRKSRQGNAVVSSLIDCDILGEVPAGSPPLSQGEMISAYRIG